jgi:hypothetical protein
VQRYGAFSIKQTFHTFFCIFFLKNNGKMPPLLLYTIYYIRHTGKITPQIMSAFIFSLPGAAHQKGLFSPLPDGLLTSGFLSGDLFHLPLTSRFSSQTVRIKTFGHLFGPLKTCIRTIPGSLPDPEIHP